MPRFNEIINNFINGEISPKVFGRMDSEIYKRSCRTLKNTIVHPQGGASKRTGTQLVDNYTLKPLEGGLDEVIERLTDATIIPFHFDEDEKYLLVFNKSQSAGSVNTISYYFVDQDAMYTATFEINTVNYNGTYTNRTSGSISDVETTDNLTNSEVLSKMKWVQIGAVIIFTHELLPPFCMIRETRGRLRFVGYADQFRGAASTDLGPWPFMDLNLSDITITASAVSVGVATFTASAGLFNAGHVGSMFAFQDSGTVGYAIITAFSSATSVSADIVRALPAGASSGTKNWYECAWSNYRGWPRSVTYKDGSLYFGGSPTFPDRVWKSQTFDIFEMTNTNVLDPGATVSASDPGYWDIAINKDVPKINWLTVGKELLVGTIGGELSSNALENGNVNFTPQTSSGTQDIQPVHIDDVPVFVQRGGRKLREIIFEERTQGYVSPEISFLAEHMARRSMQDNPDNFSQITRLSYQNLDNSILWIIDNNGFLFACTKSRENSVTAFHWHDVGGKVKSIASLPSKNGAFDELYLIVEREIDSVTRYYLEKIGAEFYETTLNPNVDDKDRIPVYSDCAKIFRRQTAANFWAPLKENSTAKIANGSTTSTETSSTSIVFPADRAVRLGKSTSAVDNEYIDYDGTDNANFPQTGTISFWAILNSTSGASAKRQVLFSIAKADSDADNLIELSVYNAGSFSTSYSLNLTINDATGTPIINDVNLGELNDRTIGLGFKVPLHFELNYDLTNGETRVFINGKQFGTTQTATGTRDTDIDLIRLGQDYADTDGNHVVEAIFWDFLIWDSVQHTENFEVYEYQPFGTTLYQLDYLEGKTVQVTANGIDLGDFTVLNGAVTIEADYEDYATIVVGLQYESIVEIQPIDLGSGIGSAMGAIKRIDRIVGRFRGSAHAKAGPDENNLYNITFRKTTTPATDPIELITDDIEFEFAGDYSRTARALVQSDRPLPMNLTAISLRGITGDV